MKLFDSNSIVNFLFSPLLYLVIYGLAMSKFVFLIRILLLFLSNNFILFIPTLRLFPQFVLIENIIFVNIT